MWAVGRQRRAGGSPMTSAEDDLSGGWNKVAAQFIARRNPSIGVSTVRGWAKSLPTGCSILDLGCGHGTPLSTALTMEGYAIYGVDASPDLVAEFRRQLPGVPVRCEPVETSTFFDRRFDAAIAIGLMFLLQAESQRQLILRISMALHESGHFLFTAPSQNVAWEDALTGRQSQSLGRDAYEATLRDAGFDLVDEFSDEGENHYYSAKKTLNAAAQQSHAAPQQP
jgi:cyclopropane fatty-acyl-phospholipid synthase-like methyltransferase